MVICSNCGFQNAAGDEFCGNCGRYLEFAGTSEAGGQQAAGAGQGPTGDQQNWSGQGAAGAAPDSPTTVQPIPAPIPNDTPQAGAGASGPAGRAPDVICWNCGRRNPAGRSFCMQCGTKLTTDFAAGAAGVGAGAGAAGVAYRRQPPEGGSGAGRGMTAIIAGLLALLLLVVIAGAVVLGLFGGPGATATPGFVAGASASPSAGASGPASSGSFDPSLVPSFGVTPLPTLVVVTFPPPTAPPPTPEPTRTPRPTCDALGAPRGCRPSPVPVVTPTPSPTPQPTPVSCAASTVATKSVTLTTEFPTRTVPENFAWCVHDVTFTNTSLPGATGTLKLYLENPEYIGPPGNYGMAKIGWPGACEASIENNFSGSNEYHPTCDYPEGYDAITEGTIVSFEIINCGTNGTCGGSVTIEFERIPAP